MFKKKNTEKKIDLSKDIESIQVQSKANKELAKSQLSKKISKDPKEDEPANQKKIVKYGLIEKEVKVEEKPKEQNIFV